MIALAVAIYQEFWDKYDVYTKVLVILPFYSFVGTALVLIVFHRNRGGNFPGS
jgi:hypothetical protein